MDARRAAVVADLRRYIASVAPVRHPTPVRLPIGIESLDRLVGGWPRPGVAVIEGVAGTGRLALVLPAMRRVTGRGHPVVVVDSTGWVHPPGLPGVALHRLLLVRSGPELALWVTEQAARAGVAPLVVLIDPPRIGRSARGLQHAAEAGDTTVVVVTDSAEPALGAHLHLTLAGARNAPKPGYLRVRQRGGGAARSLCAPREGDVAWRLC